jgi:uncharacterized protein YyaL (SSP411 family)
MAYQKYFLAVLLGFFLTAALQVSTAYPAWAKELTSQKNEQSKSRKQYNRLIHEKSPYLLQHAKNPIHWYAWGEEAFAASWEENKPIFLSIGYSTCHWCHVMETETFENEEVAALMNEAFIAIKVDREEMPDVDQFYMSVVQRMTGHGGWPMTVVMTPDLIPFFGGTYFPAQRMLTVLRGLKDGWDNDPQRIAEVGNKVREFLESSNVIKSGNTRLDENILRKIYGILIRSFDAQYGGFGNAPKFPPSTRLKILLRIAHRTGNKKALRMVESTLIHMARGGIYDHLAGGFHRYSTDKEWRVPHFEKMLYDQAALASVYIEGYQATGNKLYEQVVRGVLDYVLKDMTSAEGGYYSAEDADSEGEEGTFYLWPDAELNKILTPEEYQDLQKVYGLKELGNAPKLGLRINHLHMESGKAWQAKSNPKIQAIHAKLLAYREKRERPFKDDKVVTGWNGLMIGSMAKAAQVFGDKKYLESAQKAAGFLKSKLDVKDQLYRRYRLGEARHPASLDDYAYLIHGLINLYEADFDEGWIQWAQVLQARQDKLFWDKEDKGYYYSASEANNLPMRRKEFTDNARPNSNAVSALNLLRLYNLTFDDGYQDKATAIFKLIASRMARSPYAYGQMLVALDFFLDRSKEIAVVGPENSKDTQAILEMLRTGYIPNKVLAWSSLDKKSSLPLLKDKYNEGDQTMVYVCENNVCKFPTGDIDKIREIVQESKIYSLD